MCYGECVLANTYSTDCESTERQDEDNNDDTVVMEIESHSGCDECDRDQRTNDIYD